MSQKEQNEQFKRGKAELEINRNCIYHSYRCHCTSSDLRRLFLRDERVILYTGHHIRFQSSISFIYFSLFCCRLDHRPTHNDCLYDSDKITFIEKDCTFCFYPVLYQQFHNDLFCGLLYAVNIYPRCLAFCDISIDGFH